MSYGSLEWGDVAVARKASRNGADAVARFERAFASHLDLPGAVAFRSGRAAFHALLRAWSVGRGDEVVVPAFTCVVVPQAAVHVGARVVWADVDPLRYDYDLADLARKVGPRTRVIVAQHTFGIPARVAEIQKIADGVGARVVEDCAHTSGGRDSRGRRLGTLADGAFFSTELTKVLTLGSGGVAAARDPSDMAAVRRIAQEPPLDVVAREARSLALARLLYAPAVYPVGLFALAALYRTPLMRPSIGASERAGSRPEDYLQRMPAPSACAGLRQLERLVADNRRRIDIAHRYDRVLEDRGIPHLPHGGVPLVRYPIWAADKSAAVARFARRQIQLGTWFDHPVHPPHADRAFVRYRDGSCPAGEWLARHSVNLPTHPRLADADVDRIVAVLQAAIDARIISAPPIGAPDGSAAAVSPEA